jgi:RNA 3'-terminal phosphate cyclase
MFPLQESVLQRGFYPRNGAGIVKIKNGQKKIPDRKFQGSKNG